MISRKFAGILGAAALLTSSPIAAQGSADALSISASPRAAAGLSDGSDLGGGAGFNPLAIVAIIGSAVFFYFLAEEYDDDLGPPKSP